MSQYELVSEVTPEIEKQNIDTAGLAVEMQQMMPKPENFALELLNLKMQNKTLENKLDKLINFLKAKGLNYE